MVKPLEPVIVSASRSTDIPKYYAEWLVNRVRAGYCVWYNPFNRKPSRVSFEKTRAFVFWSKNPAPLIQYLDEFDGKYGYYFQFTLNDYVREGFEKNVGSLGERIKTFKMLSRKIGRERVIWRFDPIIMGGGLDPTGILTKIQDIGRQLKGYTSKLVFSFIDIAAYRKVQNNMKEASFFKEKNSLPAEATENEIESICTGLASLRDRWRQEGWELALATCAENVNLTKYGINCNRCIDDVLLRKLYPDDDELKEYLKPPPVRGTLDDELKEYLRHPPVRGTLPPSSEGNPLKDKGQRKECGCIQSKDIGMYNTCKHYCTYCYANSSVEAVERNTANTSPDSESIVSVRQASFDIT